MRKTMTETGKTEGETTIENTKTKPARWTCQLQPTNFQPNESAADSTSFSLHSRQALTEHHDSRKKHKKTYADETVKRLRGF